MNLNDFTNEELDFIRMAVSVQLDIMNDTLYDNVSVNLYPKHNEPTILTSEKANQLREELEGVFKNIRTMTRVADKLGLEINDLGYSK